MSFFQDLGEGFKTPYEEIYQRGVKPAFKIGENILDTLQNPWMILIIGGLAIIIINRFTK